MGIECPVCGADNRDAALVCNLCRHVLERAEAAAEPIAPDYAPEHLAALESESRRFILIMPAGLTAWVILCVLLARGAYPAWMEALPHPGWVLAAGAAALAAYAVAATARACGTPFWPSFLVSLCPPCIPGVLARAAGRPAGANLVYLLAETIVFFILALVLGGAPEGSPAVAAALAGVTAVLPLLAYNLCGGAVRELARGLGLDGWHALAWVCAGPPVIYIIFLAERVIHRGMALLDTGAEPASAGARLAQRMFGGFGHCVVAPIVLWVFAIVSVVIWMRAVHETLKQRL